MFKKKKENEGLPVVATCALCARQYPQDTVYDVLGRNVFFEVSQQRSIWDKRAEECIYSFC